MKKSMRRSCSILLALLFLLSIWGAPAWAASDLTFQGGSGVAYGFDQSSRGADLFSNFKDLYPGDSRVQEVSLRNTSDKKIDLYLMMKYVSGQELKREDKVKELGFIQDLLFDSQLMQLSISAAENQTALLYQGPLGGDKAVVRDALEDRMATLSDANYSQDTDWGLLTAVPLGALNANSQADIRVDLLVGSSMGNDYQNLSAKVEWAFVAYWPEDTSDPGPDGPTNPTDPEDPGRDPSTDDAYNPPPSRDTTVDIVDEEVPQTDPEIVDLPSDPPPLADLPDQIPLAGDDSPITWIVGIGLAALLIMAFLIATRRRSAEQNR